MDKRKHNKHVYAKFVEHETRTPNFVDPTAVDEAFQSRSWIRVPDTSRGTSSTGSGLIRSLLTRPDHLQLIDPNSSNSQPPNAPAPHSMMQRSFSKRRRDSTRNLPYQIQNSIPSAFRRPDSLAIRTRDPVYYRCSRPNYGNTLQNFQSHRDAPSTSRSVYRSSVATQLDSNIRNSNNLTASPVQGTSSWMNMLQRTPSTFPIDPVVFQAVFKQLAQQGDIFAINVMNFWNENGITDVISVEDWRRIESGGVVLISDLAACYYLSKLRSLSETITQRNQGSGTNN